MFAVYEENGRLALVAPPIGFDAREAALMAVPFGVPFIMVEDEDVPEDLSEMEAWEADFDNPDGFGMGTQRYFLKKAILGIDDGLDIEENERIIATMRSELSKLEPSFSYEEFKNNVLAGDRGESQ